MLNTDNKYSYKYKNKIKKNNKEIDYIKEEINKYKLLDSKIRLKNSLLIFLGLFLITTIIAIIAYLTTGGNDALKYILRYLNPIWLILSIFVIEPFINKRQIKNANLKPDMFYISSSELSLKYIELKSRIKHLDILNETYKILIEKYDENFQYYTLNKEKEKIDNKAKLKRNITSNIELLENNAKKEVVLFTYKKLFKNQYINIFYSCIIGLFFVGYWNYIDFILKTLEINLTQDILIPFVIGFVISIIYFYLKNRFDFKNFELSSNIFIDKPFDYEIPIETQINQNDIDIKKIQQLLIDDIMTLDLN